MTKSIPTVCSALHLVAAFATALVLPSVRTESDFPRGPVKSIIRPPARGAADVGVRAHGTRAEETAQAICGGRQQAGGPLPGWRSGLAAGVPADGHTLLHNSGKLTYATVGPGRIENLKYVQIEKETGFTDLNMPFKGGLDVAKAVISGEVDFTNASAIFAAQIAPKGLGRILAAPATATSGVEKLTPFGMHIMASKSPEDFRKLIASDAAWMPEAAKGLKLETT